MTALTWTVVGMAIAIGVLLLLHQTVFKVMKHNAHVKRYQELVAALDRLQMQVHSHIVLCKLTHRKMDLKPVKKLLEGVDKDLKRFGFSIHVNDIIVGYKEFANKMEVDYDE